MKIVKHYYIPYDENTFAMLVANDIKVEISKADNVIGYEKMIFDIYHDPEDLTLVNLIPNAPSCSWLYFSDEELCSADWLVMRPKSPKIDSRDESTLEYSCKIEKKSGNFVERGAYHHKQVSPFSLSPIKWSANNHIYSAYDGDNFVFCDDFFRNLLESRFCGVSFLPVTWWKKNIDLPNAHQLQINNVLPQSALVIPPSVSKSHCPMCGREKYEINSEFILNVKKKYLNASEDFYKTPEIFGTGRERSLWIVSNKVYVLLKSMKLTRGLIFEPVVLCD